MRTLTPAGIWPRLGLAALSAVLLDYAFPVGGPLPPWRAVLSMVALLPLLVAVAAPALAKRSGWLRESALIGYVCGVLWYALNCYWIYATMHIYGGLPPLVSAGILALFSLVLGLYFALFAWSVALVQRAFGRLLWTACAAPVLWVAVEYLAAHLICVPWDQLGYAEVDNLVLTRLAPWTGVYGISLVLAAVNVLWMTGVCARATRQRMGLISGALVVTVGLQLGSWWSRPAEAAGARAVMVQPDLSVGANMADDNDWVDRPGDPSWTRHTVRYLELSRDACTPFIAGMPQSGKPVIAPQCILSSPPAALVAWPESPAPFRSWDPRFALLLASLAHDTGATSVVGAPAVDVHGNLYNAAIITGPSGVNEGEYDKIHLVPWGEYIPFARFFAFAKSLTHNVGLFTPGTQRKVFRLPDGHTFSVFICYEAVFASGVRHFADNGAELFVNISDDGWYGDTSAPWQHLNMARMRAIENDRWLVRDTNSGVTAAIDPLGRVTQSIPRHVLGALGAAYGYRTHRTFYTRHGDVFAWLCAILAIAVAGVSLRELRHQRQVKKADAARA